MLSDNIDRAAQKGFKVCFQTDYQEKLRGHFYIDIYIAAIAVLVSCLLLFSFLISFFKRLLPFTFALPFGQRFSIPLRAGDRWFRAQGGLRLYPGCYPGLGASAPSGRA